MPNHDFNKDVCIVFDHLHNLNSKYDTSSKEFESFKQKWSGKVFYWLVIGPLIVAISLLAILWVVKGQPSVTFTALTLISIGYLGIFVFELALLLENWRGIFNFMKNPLTMILNQIKEETISDYSHLNTIKDINIESLHHVKQHLLVERDAFERRIGVLVGALEKVGLIPGILTLYLGWAKLGNKTVSIDPWIAVVIFFFYFLAIYCHTLFPRLDRYIKTLDIIIALKEKEPKEGL